MLCHHPTSLPRMQGWLYQPFAPTMHPDEYVPNPALRAACEESRSW